MDIAFFALLTFIASIIGTLVGFGTSTTLIPILVFFLPVQQTLLLVALIHFAGDVWKMMLFREGIDWWLILTFGIPGIVASFLGASLTFQASEHLLEQLMGGFLIAYVILLLLKPNFKLPENALNAVTGGAVSGFFAGLFGISGAVRSVFLSAFDLKKAIYLACTGAIAFAIDITRISTYLWGGIRLYDHIAWGLLLFIPISYLGAWTAKRLLKKIPQRRFRPFVGAFLLIAGIKLLAFPM